jgi:hypothetical protein
MALKLFYLERLSGVYVKNVIMKLITTTILIRFSSTFAQQTIVTDTVKSENNMDSFLLTVHNKDVRFDLALVEPKTMV